MDKVIKELESKPFSGEDIMTICDGKTTIIKYPDLYEYRTIDEVLKPHNTVVILYETSPSYGHWVCLIKHTKPRQYIEYFDSYGMAVDKPLEYIPPNYRKMNNEEYPKLTEMLLSSKYPIKYNNHQLQQMYQDVASCGRHVAFRIVMKDIKLGEYIKLLTKTKLSPDMVVTYLTAFQ